MSRYVVDRVEDGEWCHVGGKDNPGDNYHKPHVLYPGTSNCALCGIALVRPAVLEDGINLSGREHYV